MDDFPKTLLEAIRYFSDPDVCHKFMVSLKWPDGTITCPKCGGTKVGKIKSRRMFQCNTKDCRKQFSTKVGTIFEYSPLGLDKWMAAVWLIVNAKNGISSCELARAIGISQKSAWHLLHRIRKAMDKNRHGEKFEGVVESDETWVGGSKKNMHKARRDRFSGMSHLTPVHGLLQRTNGDEASQVIVSVVPNTRRHTLHSKIEQHVKTGITIMSDELKSYKGLDWNYVHKTINHSVQYVDGEIHTNGLENFWCLLKRSLGGTYVSVAPKHLVRYCVEQAFRFNRRKKSDRFRFVEAMASTLGKKLSWKELTKKTEKLMGC